MCPRLNAPIVLAHGMFGFDRIGLGPITLASYFRGIPDFLRAAGNRVLVTRVHPTAGIVRRAQRLGQRIEAALPGEPFHLIGHSMGGLDARQLLADPAWKGRVLSVTTIATPHLGSALAGAARSRLGGIYRLLKAIGWDHDAFLDVVPEKAHAWNRSTPAPDDVPCFSIAGDPPSDAVCWPLRRLENLMRRWEGPNDGLVAVTSAEAFGTPLPAWPVDHLRQMNWLTGTRKGDLPPWLAALYAAAVGNLARLGFAEGGPSGPSFPPDRRRGPAPSIPAIPDASAIPTGGLGLPAGDGVISRT